MMTRENRFVLTPYFLAEPVPAYRTLARPGWEVNEGPPPAGPPLVQLAGLYQPLAAFVRDALRAGTRPVSLAGDCMTSLGVLAGLQQAGVSPTLIWLDAHGDFNTWETTPSGFLGGMPLAMLTGRGEQTLVEGLALTPLPDAQVILSDARDLDPGEREAVAGSALVHLPDVAGLLTWPLPAGALYVHFDTDIMDPADAPAMNYSAPGGPPLALLQQVFRRLAGTGRVVAVSLSAWNPALDPAGQSRAAALALLATLIA